MPIPSPGTYDQASQATLVLVKAKTDNIGATVALEAAGNLAAVKAKTDNIGATVALESAGNLASVKTRTDPLGSKIASGTLRNSHDAEVTTVATAYTLRKTMTLTAGLRGQARFTFDHHGGASASNCKIYRNGAALSGNVRNSTGTYVTATFDITQEWAPGDTCEVWEYTENAGYPAYLRNFRLYYDDYATGAVASANS